MARKEELLKATVSVDDKASKQFDKITKSMNKQNNELLRLKASMEKVRAQSRKKNDFQVETKKAVNEVNRLEKAFKNLQTAANRTRTAIEKIRGIGSMMMPNGLSLAAGVAAGGYFGKQIFDSTFLKAAEYEVSEKTIQAMFNNQKQAQEYMKSIEAMAISSPLLNSADMFNNSGMFISLTKNQKQLEKIWDLTERLTARNPNEALGGGVFGASYALSSAFSGDLVSLKERFNLNTKELDGLGKLKLDDQLKELDKYFSKLGMTEELVNEVGDTTLGIWNQIGETMSKANRQIGEPAVKIIKPFLDDINNALQSGKVNKYVKFGQDMAAGIAQGFVSGARNLGSWIDGIASDPNFQKLTSLEAKVGFVFDDIYQRFTEWLNTGGTEKIQDSTDKLTAMVVNSIQASLPKILPIATEVGISIGNGILDGIKSALDDFKITPRELYSENVLPSATPKKKSSKTSKKSTSSTKPKPSYAPTVSLRPTGNKAHAFGIQRVPRDNYPALLHEGERVQTKQEANQNKGNGEPSVSITIQNMTVREEADIQKIAKEFVREWKKERLNVGGVPQ
ncbi:hypothetical protein [Metabacillus sp. B2-18]|uniref:hypothetical protein n=1 Tax=Metabacillus sp. B2-18 TaxID=2897333 RepID=UPI001E45EB41|nr:hypothetical protein [Metabacillus sp. B2-18]UGB31711.1 hypothetical protein LPC09_04305 [Metabacillus sp. B2-18]